MDSVEEHQKKARRGVPADGPAGPVRIGYFSDEVVHYEDYCGEDENGEDCGSETDGPLTGNFALVTCPQCITKKED